MLDCAQYASIADMSSCCTCGSVRGHPKLSSFSQEYTEYAGGGVNGLCTLFKNVDIMLCKFALKINFLKVLFWDGGVSKKSIMCTLLIMLTIIIVDDPLTVRYTCIQFV